MHKQRTSSEDKLMQTFGSVLSSIRSEASGVVGGGSSRRSGASPNVFKPNSNPDLIDSDDDASSDGSANSADSSSASSLNEEEIRDVVRQVLVMVKHNRRSGSNATRTPSHSVESAAHGRGSSEAVAHFLVPSSGRGSPVVTDPHASMPRLHSNNDTTERKLLRSANVSTYASMVGIVRKPRSTTPDPPPVLSAQRNHTDTAAVVGASGATSSYEATPKPTAVNAAKSVAGPMSPPANNNNSAIRFSKKRTSAAVGPTSPGNAWGSTPRGKGTATVRPKLGVRSPTTPHNAVPTTSAPPQMDLHAQSEHHHVDASAHYVNGALIVPDDDDDALPTDQQNRSLVEQRRLERLQRQRADAMRDETFTPRTSRDVHDIPDTIRNVPLRGKGHWEDRLYTEYHSRKQQRALECEALRIAKATQQEIEEALDECSFAPDIRGIHNQLTHFKKNSPALRGEHGNSSAVSSRGGSRSGSAVALGNRERAAITTERLYGNTVMKAQAREDAAREYNQRLQREATERKERLAEAKPSHTQLRLYEEHVRRKAEHERLVEEQRERMRANAFVFNIKGNYYETLPLPQQADPGSFERLYNEGRRRNDKRTQAQAEALARRPSPTPLISPFAQRRVHSAQPVYERLAHAKPQRSVSPAVMGGGRQQQSGGSTKVAVTPPPQSGTMQSPLHADAFHAGLASHQREGGARSEFIIHWMGRNSASVSRQSSLGKDAAVTPPPMMLLRPTGASPVGTGAAEFPSATTAATASGIASGAVAGTLNSDGPLPSPRPLPSNQGSSRPASPVAERSRRESASPSSRPLEPPAERFVEVSSDSASSTDGDEDDDLALVVAKKPTVARLPVAAH